MGKRQLSSRKSKPHPGFGWQYRLKDRTGAELTNGYAYDLVSARTSIDRMKMSVVATISDSTEDRVGDILEPMGCVLDDYRKNPIVMWNHGLDPAVPLPIGVAQDEDGNLAIEITEDEVIGTTYFAQRNPFAVQVFQLIDDGIIRAVSVRETPLEARQIVRNGRSVMYVPRWTLEEFSWTCVGVNPSAVRKCIDRNRLDGRAIHPAIMKSLNAAVPRVAKTGKGWSKAMNEDDDLEDDELENLDESQTKSDDEVDEIDGESLEETPADEVEGDDDGDEGEEGEREESVEQIDSNDPADHPYGKQLIDAAHGFLLAAAQGLKMAQQPTLEHEGVREDLAAVEAGVKNLLKSLEGSHAKNYPGFACNLKSDDIEDLKESLDADEAMKSFLASTNIARNEMYGVPHRLKSLLRDKGLSAASRKSLKGVIVHLDSLLKRAEVHKKSLTKKRAQKSASKSATADAEQSKIEELAEQLSKLKKVLSS